MKKIKLEERKVVTHGNLRGKRGDISERLGAAVGEWSGKATMSLHLYNSQEFTNCRIVFFTAKIMP